MYPQTQAVPAHVFDSHPEAHQAIKTLFDSGFDVGQLSLMGTRGPAVVVVGGVGLLHGALADAGLEWSQIMRFETAIEAGKFVLMVGGGTQEQARAAAVLSGSRRPAP